MVAVFWILTIGAVLAATGFFYQFFGARHDRRLYSSLGRWIDIGDGLKLYVMAKGAGGPTVLFESGIAATNLNWFHVQEIVSRFTSTASYDRGGLGWSSPNRTGRTPGNIAQELHAMLEGAGIEPPYILVGHSFGGLVMRRFALLYPEDVAGVLLVDPMRCEEWPPLNPGRQSEVDRGKKLSGIAIPIARFGLARLAVMSLLFSSGKVAGRLARVGGTNAQHVLRRVKDEVDKMPREVRPIVAAHWSSPGFYAGMRSHLMAVPDTVREMLDAEPIHRIPVVVLTPGKSTPLSGEKLALIGDNAQQVIAPASAHWIHLDEPDLVIDSIREMVMAVAAEPVAASV